MEKTPTKVMTTREMEKAKVAMKTPARVGAPLRSFAVAGSVSSVHSSDTVATSRWFLNRCHLVNLLLHKAWHLRKGAGKDSSKGHDEKGGGKDSSKGRDDDKGHGKGDVDREDKGKGRGSMDSSKGVEKLFCYWKALIPFP